MYVLFIVYHLLSGGDHIRRMPVVYLDLATCQEDRARVTNDRVTGYCFKVEEGYK